MTDQDESERRFAKIFASTPSAVVITRLADRVILEGNDSFFSLAGYARDAVIGRTSVDFDAWVNPEDRDYYFAEIGAGRSVRGLRTRFRTRGGALLYAAVNGEPIELHGAPCALSVMTDVTAEQRYLKQIERQHQLFAQVFESVPDAFLISSPTRRVLMANRAVEAVFGHPIEDVIGRPDGLLFASEEQFERLERERFHPGAGVYPEPCTLRYRRADGSTFDGETIATVIRDQRGQLLGYLAIVRDVSVREEIGRALALGEQRLGELIDTMGDWYWEVDREPRFTEVSRRVLDALGYDPGWLVGKTPAEILYPDEEARAREVFEAALAQGRGVKDLDLEHRHKSGERRVLRLNTVPIRDADGGIIGVRGISRDVTAARQADAALAASQAELAAIFDNANVGIMRLTGYRILSRCNQRLADILGYPDPASMVGLSMRSLHLSDERFVTFGREHYQRLRDREQLHVEVQLRRRDGTAVWCLLSGKAMDRNRPADLNQGVIWTVDDIDHIKHKEQELERLNARLEEEHALFTSGPALVLRWRAEPGWPVDYCSASVEQVLGIPASALKAGRPPFAELIHPDDRARVAAEIEAHLAAGHEGYEREYRLLTRDGHHRYFFDYTRVLRDATGRVSGYHGYLVDVTEQRRNELQLRALLDALPDPIFFKDADGRYLECNEALARVVGRSRAETIGARDTDLFAGSTAEVFRACDQKAMEQGECQRQDWISFPDGARRLLDTRRQRFTRAGDDLLGVLAISRDITEEHLQAHALKRAQRLAGVGSSHLDLRTGKFRWSAQLYALLGLEADGREPSMALLASLVEPEDRDAFQRVLVDLDSVRRGQAELEFRIRRANDGARRCLYSRRELVCDDQGEPVRAESVVQDITDQQQARQSLAASEELYRLLFERSGQPLLLLEPDGAIIQANQAAAELLGYQDAESLGGAPLQSISPERQPDGEPSADKARSLLDQAMALGVIRFEWDHSDVAGRVVPTEVSLARVRIGDRAQLLGTWYDLRDRRRADELEQRAATVFAHTAEGIVVTDAENRIVAVNPAFTQITGYEQDEVLGRLPSLLQSGRHGRDYYRGMWASLNETGRWQGDVWNRRKDGEVYPQRLSLGLVRGDNGEVRNHIGVFHDLSEEQRSEARIAELTHYSPATGLPNQQLLQLELRQAVQSALAGGKSLAALSLNLDGFKHVVGSYGHAAADAALGACAERLRAVVPEAAILAHPAADTFVVALNLDDAAAATAEALTLQQALRQEGYVQGIGQFAMSCCVGIATAPADAQTAESLLRCADVALHTAKQSGPGSVAFYRPEMTAAAKHRVALERALRKALTREAFELVYQPKLDLRSGRLCGAEALIRWRQADGTVLSPDAFMPVVEGSDLVHQVGRWVIDTVVQAIDRWRRDGRMPVPVSLNVSSATLSAGLLAPALEDAIEATGIDPALLEVEVLENVLLKDPEQAKAELRRVRRLGVRIALDDFGTGYSSLSYLKQFAFDTLKIDRGFIMDLEPNSGDTAIVRSTLSMAHQLGIEVVAEGVSTDAQIRLLRQLGCEKAQGYHIGKPLAHAEFTALLADPAGGLDPALRAALGRLALLVGGDDAEGSGAAGPLSGRLEARGWRLRHAGDPAAARRLIAEASADMLICDAAALGDLALDLLEEARRTSPATLRVLRCERAVGAELFEAINRARVFYCLDAADGQGELDALLALADEKLSSAG